MLTAMFRLVLMAKVQTVDEGWELRLNLTILLGLVGRIIGGQAPIRVKVWWRLPGNQELDELGHRYCKSGIFTFRKCYVANERNFDRGGIRGPNTPLQCPP